MHMFASKDTSLVVHSVPQAHGRHLAAPQVVDRRKLRRVNDSYADNLKGVWLPHSDFNLTSAA